MVTFPQTLVFLGGSRERERTSGYPLQPWQKGWQHSRMMVLPGKSHILAGSRHTFPWSLDQTLYSFTGAGGGHSIPAPVLHDWIQTESPKGLDLRTSMVHLFRLSSCPVLGVCQQPVH